MHCLFIKEIDIQKQNDRYTENENSHQIKENMIPREDLSDEEIDQEEDDKEEQEEIGGSIAIRRKAY